MKILFLSAFYPPHVIGGWEQLVHDINLRLQARGHETMVLTSDYGVEGDWIQRDGVDRGLKLESDLLSYSASDFFLRRPSCLRHNLEHTRKVIEAFDPDVIFVHVMWNLSYRIPQLAEQLRPGRVVYYIASDWPYAQDVNAMYWQEPARKQVRRAVKQLLGKLVLAYLKLERRRYPLNFEHVLCVSRAIQEKVVRFADVPLDRTRVIYNGIELDRFVSKGEDRTNGRNSNRLAMVYAGSLVPHKGVHTAIEAMQKLVQVRHVESISLDIIGSGNPEYEQQLKDMVTEARLNHYVRFKGRYPREMMPELLPNYDVLVFPSIWEEPLARIVQEAMACGLVVIGTTTGGTPEILDHRATGLVFEPGDSIGLANQVEHLLEKPEMRHQLVENGQKVVQERFDLNRMIDEIESFLTKIIDEKGRISIHEST